MAQKSVAVVGAGPTGSLAAGLLAEAGHHVEMFERERFPRQRVGESLLPIEMGIFRDFGLEFDSTFALKKDGARFEAMDGTLGVALDFAEANTMKHDHAYQVDRARFDQRLADLAVEKGVTFTHGQVLDAIFSNDKVRLETDQGTKKVFDYLIDASGRACFLGRKFRSLQRGRGFGVVAAFRHFEDVNPDIYAEMASNGYVVILVGEDFWGWVIPLPNQRVGVGFVSKTSQRNIANWYEQQLMRSPLTRKIAENSVPQRLKTEADFSYRNEKSFGMRYACLGDAAAFLDPVFSSGVALGAAYVRRAVPIIDSALANHTEARADLMAEPSADMNDGYVVFAALIDRFYQTGFADSFFFAENTQPQTRRELVALLAGDVWDEGNEFRSMLLNSRHFRSLRQRSVAFG